MITVLGPPSHRPGEARLLLPAIIDTLELLALRPGWLQASARSCGASALPTYAPRSLPTPGSGDVLRLLPSPVEDDLVTLWDCSLSPLQDLECLQEVIVHSLISPPTRTYISTLWRPDRVEAFLVRLLDIPQASLCWPTWAPCMAGDPVHLALVPLALGDRFVLVDARRVHPTLDYGLWLIPAPERLSRAELMAVSLDGREVAITPAGFRLNGVRVTTALSLPIGISLVTLQAHSLGGLQCVANNLAALAHLPGFCAAYSGSLTSTTTMVPSAHSGLALDAVDTRDAPSVSSSTTTTTVVDRAALMRSSPDVRGSFIMALAGKPIRFHVVGPAGRVEIAATVREVTLEAVLTQLCLQLHDAQDLRPGLLFQACDRIVSDTDWGFSVFLCCRPADHEGLAWIDARPMGLPPFAVSLPFVLDEQSLQRACGVEVPFDACIAICGIPWYGVPHALQHCDVVSIRANVHQLFTLPLAALNSRVAGFAALLVPQRGPEQVPVPRGNARPAAPALAATAGFSAECIFANWRLVHLSSSLALCTEDVYQKCVLVALDFPPLPVTIGARVSPVEDEVNCWYQTWLKPVFGDRWWRSSGLAFGDYTVFFDGAISDGTRRPWITCIGEEVDVIIAGPNGEGLESWPAPEGWVVRPTAIVGPIGQAALQQVTSLRGEVVHLHVPDSQSPEVSVVDPADDYDRISDPFLPSWSSLGADEADVVWVSMSLPAPAGSEQAADTAVAFGTEDTVLAEDNDPARTDAMALLQTRAVISPTLGHSKPRPAAGSVTSVPTPCGRVSILSAPPVPRHPGPRQFLCSGLYTTKRLAMLTAC